MPTELLGKILTLVDFDTKIAAHAVCRQWNQVLRHPTGCVWRDVPPLCFHQNKLERQTRQLVIRRTSWLGARAAGIGCLTFHSGQWRCDDSEITGARFFAEKQLPHLLGQLQLAGRPSTIALTTGDMIVRHSE